jgi:hypothetical protein
MLHKTLLPIDPAEVAGITDLQIRLLQLAASTDRLDKGAVENWFPDQELSGWIVRNWPCAIGSLKELARDCPVNTKAALLRAVAAELRMDNRYWAHYADPNFVIQFAETDQWRKLIAKWLRGFYEQFRQAGLEACATGRGQWSKREWALAFRTKNPTVVTCPQCDGTMKGGLTAEHVLPREKYAPLSVHPMNLIPCCGDCQKLKANQDPLERIRPNRLFLPYWQHALEHCDVRATENVQGNWEFVVVSREATCDWRDAIRALNHLYGIPEQWNRNSEEIVNLATAKIDEKVASDRADGRQASSMAEFQARLDALCFVMKEQWGRQHYFVPATAWIQWAKVNMLDRLWQKYGVM